MRIFLSKGMTLFLERPVGIMVSYFIALERIYRPRSPLSKFPTERSVEKGMFLTGQRVYNTTLWQDPAVTSCLEQSDWVN